MKLKRMLAAAVCFAMIATSSALPTVVSAAEIGENTEVTVTAEEQEVPVQVEEQQEATDEVIVDIPEEVNAPVNDEETEIIVEEEAEDKQQAVNDGSDSFQTLPDDVTPGFSVEGGVLKYTGGGIYDEAILIDLPAGTTNIPRGLFDGGSILSSVKEIYFTKNSGTVNINDSAFDGNLVIRHVDGSHVATVGRYAFNGCSSLNSFALDTVTDIGAGAFSGTGLMTVNLTSAVSIGASAFSNCSSLSDVVWGPDIETIGDSAFANCSFTTLTIDHLYALEPDGIGTGAFANNKRLVSATLPYQVEIIPQSAFKGCDKLAKVNLSETDALRNKVDNMLTTVGASAFESCAALKEIKLGKYVTEVGSLAFSGCKELVLIMFYQPEGDVNIDVSAIEAKGSKDNKGVIKARGGKVKEFFDTNLNGKGWTYAEVELFKITIKNPSGGKITSNVSKAAEGEEIKLTVTASSGNTVTGIKVNDVYLEAEQGKNLYSATPEKQVYVFKMPGGDATITATSDTLANVFKGNKLAWTFTPGSYGANNQNLLKFPKAGGSTKIRMFNDTTKTPIDLWNFTMTSSDPSTVTISEFGEISAVKKGSAIITLKPRVSGITSVELTADVAKSAEIESISFEKYLEETIIKDATVLEPHSEYNKNSYYVVEFSVDDIAKADHKFSPKVVATDSESEELLINSNWTSTNTKVATLANAKTNLNENTITIKKGTAAGETYIKVVTINEDSGKPVEGGLIVRVLDTAPRMKQNSVQVNVAQPGGTTLQCEPVYGFSLVPSTLRVCTLSTPNGSPVYTDNDYGFAAMYKTSSQDILLSVSNVKNKYPAGSETTFVGKRTLYIVGKQKRNGSDDEVTFHMPIKEVVVVNSKPEINLTYSSKINLLYNDDYLDATGEPLQNYAKLNFGITNVKEIFVEDVKFVTTANYKKSKTEVPDDDELAANFEYVKPITNAAGYHTGIVVKVAAGIDDDDDFAKDKDENIINSGYVKIKFKGFNTTSFNIPVTIPCAYTNPKYSLSTAKVTTSKYFKDPEYLVQIMDNSVSPKRCVELYEGDEDSRTEKPIIMYNVYGTTPSSFFNEPELDHSEPAKDAKGKKKTDPVTGKQLFNDYIKLSAKGTPVKAKEKIAFRMPGWRKVMTFDFNMAVTNSALKGKCVPSTLTMNKKVPSQAAKMEFSFNLGDAKVVDCDEFEYKASAKTAEAYEELVGAFSFVDEDYDEDGNKIPAHILVNLDSCDLDSIPKGNYSFTARPEVQFGTNGKVPANERPAVKFKISVTNTDPKISLKKNKFILNTHYSGMGETATVETKVSALAKNAKYELSESEFDDIHIEAISKNLPNGWKGEIKDASGNWTVPEGSWKDSFELVICEDDNKNNTKLGVRLKSSVPDSTFSYDYYIYGLPVTINNDVVKTDKVKITVSGHEKWETVTLSTKNVFNQIIAGKFSPANERVVVPGYEMVYTATIKNLNGTIDDVKLEEINNKTRTPYGPNYSPHFYVPENGVDQDKKTITILLNRENIMGGDGIEPIQTGKEYPVVLRYHIKERDGKESNDVNAKWGELDIKITPKQVLPVLQQVRDKKTMYVGSSDDVFYFEAGLTTCQTAVVCNCADPDDDDIDTYGKTEYTKIADSASTEIRRAFKVISVQQFDDEGDPLFLTDTNGNYILDKNKDKIPCVRVIVQLVEPSILVGGKSYTVPIEIRYENQDKYTKGNNVNFKVTVVK